MYNFSLFFPVISLDDTKIYDLSHPVWNLPKLDFLIDKTSNISNSNAESASSDSFTICFWFKPLIMTGLTKLYLFEISSEFLLKG